MRSGRGNSSQVSLGLRVKGGEGRCVIGSFVGETKRLTLPYGSCEVPATPRNLCPMGRSSEGMSFLHCVSTQCLKCKSIPMSLRSARRVAILCGCVSRLSPMNPFTTYDQGDKRVRVTLPLG